MPSRRYDLLALDLDGTLFDRRGRISEANRHAVAAARAAGMRVVVCTGRGLVESRAALTEIAQEDPVVVAGGAIIACPTTARTIHRFAIGREIVAHAVDLVLSMDHAALVLKDPSEAGYDYLCVRGARSIPLDPVTEWWFEKMDVKVRHVASLDDDEHPGHTVRVGACGVEGMMARVKASLHTRFVDRLAIHHFGAVVAPDHASRADGGEKLHVLEVFDKDANKWSAISRLAREYGIPHERIAAVGDEINDVSMIQGAGLGVAMGNAIPSVKDAAKRHTKDNESDGVAHAVENILSGAW